ncbi:MAG: dockerin type I domain-containing protein [Candidatus Electrothrix communis]|nr:MAG: dockerin type I domain-containing protein [Candidatus Electrothrix communis]
MKKFTSTCCAALLTLGLLTTNTHAACNDGDVNRDGEIDITDIYEVNKARDRTEPYLIDYADCDDDGEITMRDIVLVANKITDSCLPGDADKDGHVTPYDGYLVREMILGNQEETVCGDCNEDGIISGNDVGCITDTFNTPNIPLDCNGDGTLNVLDLRCFDQIMRELRSAEW